MVTEAAATVVGVAVVVIVAIEGVFVVSIVVVRGVVEPIG